MNLIDSYYKPGTIGCFTFVLDEQDPRTRFYTMLATDSDGVMFSQFTEGMYDPAGNNKHLGRRIVFGYLGKRLVNHVLDRIEEE